jgi:1,4-dihydroxy-2-naphthoate octaprenyltransferase
VKRIFLWIRIVRPWTLPASISPVAAGLAASHCAPLDRLTAAVTLVTAMSIQVLANLVNDYLDFRNGRDRAGRTGPKRALAEAEVTLSGMENAVAASFLAAVAGGAFLVWKGGLVILAIGCAALFCAWLYSATSRSLANLGIADIFVFLFFGPVASAGSAYLQDGTLRMEAVLPGVVTGLVSMAVLTVNNLRDEEADRNAGKRTIVVRFGRRFGVTEYAALFALCVPAIAASGGSWSFAAPAAGAALSCFVCRAHGRQFNRLLALTGLVNLLYAVLFIFER